MEAEFYLLSGLVTLCEEDASPPPLFIVTDLICDSSKEAQVNFIQFVSYEKARAYFDCCTRPSWNEDEPEYLEKRSIDEKTGLEMIERYTDENSNRPYVRSLQIWHSGVVSAGYGFYRNKIDGACMQQGLCAYWPDGYHYW